MKMLGNKIDAFDQTHKLKCLLEYCQAQFQLASPVPVELSWALSFIITTPTHPGK